MKNLLVLFALFVTALTAACAVHAQGAGLPQPGPGPVYPEQVSEAPPTASPEESVLGVADTSTLPAPPAGWLLSAGSGEAPEETPEAVAEETPEETQDPDAPLIALTFDDGPSEYTTYILELLEENGGAATFCAIGNRLERYEDTVRLIAESESEIIGHSWNHQNLARLTEDAIREQLVETNTAIEELTGSAPVMYRPPYGSVSKRVRKVSEELGLSMLYWSVDTQDWKSRDADAIYAHIMEKAEDGAIILCHDIYASTAEAMERVIPELTEQGYRLVTVSELFRLSGTEPVPGELYRNAE